MVRRFLIPLLLIEVLCITAVFAGSISGTVTDRSTGSPLAGATIQAMGGREASPMFFAVSDTGGNYILKNLPAGEYRVSCAFQHITVSDSVPVVVGEGAAVTGINFLITLEHPLNNSVSGKVFNAKAHLPIVGATARLSNMFSQMYTAQTDSAGGFAFHNVPAGNYYLSAVAAGFNGHTYNGSIFIGPDAHLTGFDIELTPIVIYKTAIIGHVTDSVSGLPIAGAFIFDGIETFAVDSLHQHWAYSDSSGFYMFTNIYPRVFGLSCRATGYLPAMSPTFQVVDGETTTVDFKLTAEAHGSIAGTVKLTNGAPLRGAHIEFVSNGPWAANCIGRDAVTDSSGNYSASLPAGNYFVFCMAEIGGIRLGQWYKGGADSMAAVSVVNDQTTSGIDFIFTPPRQIHAVVGGTVTDRQGNPLKGARISAGMDSMITCSADDHLGGARTDSAGHYMVSINVTARESFRFALSAEARGFAIQFYNNKPVPWLADFFVVAGDTTITGINFALDSLQPIDHNNSISGTVTGITGAPIPNALVFARGSVTREARMAVTDSAGNYTVGNLINQNYIIAFAARGFVCEIYNNVHRWEDATPVAANGAVTGIDAVLDTAQTDSLGGTIVGIMHDDHDNPLPGVLATLTDGLGNLINSTISLSDGSYSLGGIRNGEYLLIGTGAGYTSTSTPVTLNGQATSAVAVNLSLTYQSPASALSFGNGWNLVSLPMHVSDPSLATLLPGFTGHLFQYSSQGYIQSSQLAGGHGYWIKSGSGSGMNVDIVGDAVLAETLTVQEGWNLIGAVSVSAPVSDIMSAQPGFIVSQFFGYSEGYYKTEMLLPGQGYWVKVKAAGTLIIGEGTTGSLYPVTVLGSSENPPPAPDVSSATDAKPTAFALHQNHPNPFNPTTIITYDLPSAVHVTLKVYNILGVEVASLINGTVEAGLHQVTWDASAMPSGVYFYKINAGSTAMMKKMMLIK